MEYNQILFHNLKLSLAYGVGGLSLAALPYSEQLKLAEENKANIYKGGI